MHRRVIGFVLGAAFLLTSLGATSNATTTAEPEIHRFAAHAMTLRDEIVQGNDVSVLTSLPGIPAQPPSGLWPAFFENTVVTLGRLLSSEPMALYYNPLLDVAVSTAWERRDGGWRIAKARALPGERLNGSFLTAPPLPAWLVDDGSPVEALAATTVARLEAFRRLNPPGAADALPDASTFAQEAAEARTKAWPRLLWNVRQRARWTSGEMPWLRPALVAVNQALSAGASAAVTAAAPATDRETAEAIAGLPPGLAEQLVLDMVVEAGVDGRLLFGSLPEDGDLYFLVLCRLEGEGASCPLRRILMVSLIDIGGAPAAAPVRE